MFASRRLTFTFTNAIVAVNGDVAIERLHYTATVRAPDGETSEDVGKGIHTAGEQPPWDAALRADPVVRRFLDETTALRT